MKYFLSLSLILLLFACQTNTSSSNEKSNNPTIKKSAVGSNNTAPLKKGFNNTHTVTYFAAGAVSTTDARQALLTKKDSARLVGTYQGRHIINKKKYFNDNPKDIYFIDKFIDGKPILHLLPEKSTRDCQDIILVDSLWLLSQPVSEDRLQELVREFKPIINKREINDYIEFSISKNTPCNIIDEEESHWKIIVRAGGMDYVGYILKEWRGENTLQKKCSPISGTDSRAAFVPPSIPASILGKYVGQSETDNISFELEVFMDEGFLKGNLTHRSRRMGEGTPQTIFCFYQPKDNSLSFIGIIQRTELELKADGTFTGRSASVNFTGRKE